MPLKQHTFSLAVIVSGLLIGLTFYLGPRALVNGSRIQNVDMTRYTGPLSEAHTNESAQTVADDSEPQSATVSIHTDPPGAQISIGSDSLGRSPIENYSTRAGALFLTLEKPDYAPLDTLIIAEANQHLTASFELTPAGTEPPELAATGESNSARSGQTASNAESTPEPASPSGAESVSSVNDEESTEPPNTSSPPPTEVRGTVRATSTPSAASLWIDGRHVGTTPIRLSDIEPGTHRVSFEKSGYEPLHTTVEVESGSTETVNASLTRATGTFSVLVKPWGSIYIDGELHEPDTDLQYTTQLSAGQHLLRVVHPNLGIWEQSVEVDADTRRELVIDLTQVDTRQPE